MKELVWKFGEKPDKSAKRDLNKQIIENKIENTIENKIENTLETDVILNHNKREQVDMKLNERMMIGQRNKNPYFADTSYLDDLKTQDEFLKPQSSNI